MGASDFDHRCQRDHLRFFVDGLVVGAKEKVEEWLLRMQHRGTYRRRKNPIALPKQSPWFALHEQRSTLRVGERWWCLIVDSEDTFGLGFVHARFDEFL